MTSPAQTPRRFTVPAWTAAGALVLAAYGGALLLAPGASAGWPGVAIHWSGVALLGLAILLVRGVRGAAAVAVLVSTSGIVLAGIATSAVLAGRDAFAPLGGTGGDVKNELAALAAIAIGHLVILRGGRAATARPADPDDPWSTVGRGAVHPGGALPDA